MDVLRELRFDFPESIRRSGEDYYRRGLVRLIRAQEDILESEVRGSDLYTVTIQWNPDLSLECTCPYFQDRGQPCKHLWATLLAAEQQGKLPSAWPENPDDSEDYDSDWPSPIAMPKPRNEPARHAVWRRRLAELRNSAHAMGSAPRGLGDWPADRRIVYVLDVSDSDLAPELRVELWYQDSAPIKPNASRFKKLRMMQSHVVDLPDRADRTAMSMLVGLARDHVDLPLTMDQEIPRELILPRPADAVEAMCRTGRCRLRANSGTEEGEPISWDDAGPWELVLAVIEDEAADAFRLGIALQRNGERLELSQAKRLVAGGVVFIGDKGAPVIDGGGFEFARLLRHEPDILIPREQGGNLIAELATFPRLPRMELPAALGVTEVRQAPRPCLKVKAPSATRYSWEDDRLRCSLWFDYNGVSISPAGAGAIVYSAEHRQLLHRDTDAEARAMSRMRDLGFRRPKGTPEAEPEFRLHPKQLASVVRALTNEQWRIEVEGKVYRQGGKINVQVSSGIDWFELQGHADFDGMSVALPKLLRAIAKGEDSIILDDGTIGLLPEEWLSRYGLLAAAGQPQEESVQFAKTQAGLLDALLAEMPEVRIDETFARVRQELRRFDGITAIEAPPTFIGLLRPYQKEGLGWLEFLRSFGLGGCLADDMGLGKTIQVLAMLDHRRGQAQGPSLVVVPRSLVFNWQSEAAKFTPQLRVLDHAASDRLKATEHFSDYDLILTTYGTLRNDAVLMKDVAFDYVILDEAQAIKNSASESAKASRLLRARHRLALSGTPVQNHLGELWSLLEFLNPGLLGASRSFGAAVGKFEDPQTRRLLSAAVRPFILRRTKEQVARDLPEKTEQTLYCELDAKQRAAYDELKEHYRQSLMTRIAEQGINRSRIQILEALLRLRQAACHPGLLDKSRVSEGSAKLDTLLPRLAEVIDEGHKAIVFSQFTSFLSIVREKLDGQAVTYEYLDGKTRDRRQRVERFQTDPACKIFLVSLKAGGVGLNLTAAQYVFLLDPWWNPAIEAQAIDRAHRIGQTNHVFAYRLIARGTVEEKVVQLQQTKRELADAIINADNAMLAKLGKEELELLLS